MTTFFRYFFNRAGITYDELKTDVVYAEDLNLITSSINQIESFLSDFQKFSYNTLNLPAPVPNDPPLEFELPFGTSFRTHIWSLDGYMRLLLPVVPKKYVVYTLNNYGIDSIEVATYTYSVNIAPDICIIAPGQSVTIYNNQVTYLVK